MTYKPQLFLSANLSGFKKSSSPQFSEKVPRGLTVCNKVVGGRRASRKGLTQWAGYCPGIYFPVSGKLLTSAIPEGSTNPWSETAPSLEHSTAVNLQADYLRELTFCAVILKQICLLPINQQGCFQLQTLCWAGWRCTCLGGTELERLRDVLTSSPNCSHDPA